MSLHGTFENGVSVVIGGKKISTNQQEYNISSIQVHVNLLVTLLACMYYFWLQPDISFSRLRLLKCFSNSRYNVSSS